MVQPRGVINCDKPRPRRGDLMITEGNKSNVTRLDLVTSSHGIVMQAFSQLIRRNEVASVIKCPR